MIEKTTLVDLNKWRKEQKEEIARKEKLLADQMKAAVPKNLAKWLDARGKTLIETIIKEGKGTDIIRLGHATAYDFISLTEFSQRLLQLEEAWNHNVEVFCHWKGQKTLEVLFKAFNA